MKNWRWLAILLCFLWLAFVYASFYLVQQQRPVDGENLGALAALSLAAAAAVGIWIVATAAGHRIGLWLGIPMQGREQFLVGGGIGLGALSFLFLGLGLAGWLARWLVLAVVGVLALLLLPDLTTLRRGVWQMRSLPRPPKWLWVYLGLTSLMTLVLALAPPTDWDGLFYHLTLPKLYIAQGHIAPVLDLPHQHFPGLMEMLYMAAMILGGDTAAKLLHFGYMLLLGGVVYLLAERHVRQGLGWPAVVVYAAIPMVSVLGGWAYNDLALAFYQLAALYALFHWFDGRGRPWLALSGVFCGLAMGLKYTSFVCPLVVAFLLLWHGFRSRQAVRGLLGALALFGGIALVTAAPWYVRNWAFTGNPVYPFAFSIFGGIGWDDWRAAWYARAGSGLGWDLGALLKLAWTTTLGLRDMNFYDGRMGPLFLLALPFLVAWVVHGWATRRARPRAVNGLLLFALAQCLFWTVGVISSRSLFQSRLLLPALVALCVPLVVVFDSLRALDTRVLSLRRLIGMSVVLVLAANLVYQSFGVLRLRPLPVLVGEESREAFLSRTLGAHYAAMTLINQRVPEDARVLFLWEPRSYYCERDAQPDPILERWAWLVYRYGGDAGAIARSLRGDGYTYVLFYSAGLDLVRQAGLDPLTDADLAAWDTFTRDFLRQEAEVGSAYRLYRLAQPSVQE